MDIIYRSKNVEKQCRDLKKAQKDFASFGEKIIAKINLIESMNSFSDIMNYSPFHCHKLSGMKCYTERAVDKHPKIW